MERRKSHTKMLTMKSIGLAKKEKIGTHSLSPRRTKMNLQDILKPYYLEQMEYDSQGELIRSKSPQKFLENFNPIPSPEKLQKLNFYFYPYNRSVLTQNSMQFQRNEKRELLEHLKKLKGDKKLSEEIKEVIEAYAE